MTRLRDPDEVTVPVHGLPSPATRWNVQCLNCRGELIGPFCSNCGQRAVPPHPTARELAGDAVHEFTGWDGKFAATIRTLLRRPGELTRQWLEGRRVRFISPLRLYLTASLLYFVVAAAAPTVTTSDGRAMFVGLRFNLTATGMDAVSRPERVADAASRSFESRTGSGITQAERDSALAEIAAAPPYLQPMLRKMVDDPTALRRAMGRLMPRVLFVLLPLFAGILALFYRRRHYPEHLYFAIHLHAFFFVALLIASLAKFTNVFILAAAVQLAALAWCFGYGVLAARRVYGGSLGITALKAAGVSVLYLIVAAPILFAAVFLAAALGP